MVSRCRGGVLVVPLCVDDHSHQIISSHHHITLLIIILFIAWPPQAISCSDDSSHELIYVDLMPLAHNLIT
eukprot:1322772-Amorphochlora_amoeboformis.AAC.1